MLYSGCYENKEIAAHISDTLARTLMKNGEHDHKLNFPERRNASKYIGLSYEKDKSKWAVRRWSKYENKSVSNGYYFNEETAAHASDTLARKLIKNGEEGHKLNFSDDDTEVYPKEKIPVSEYFGVTLNKSKSKWCASRWSKNERKMVYNGYLDDKETAARSSDTLARKLMKNGENGHKLNFPDDYSVVYSKESKFSSKYFGVSYNKSYSKWYSSIYSKNRKTMIYNGCYNNEERAAYASDTLVRKLMKNGEQNHKLNFPDDDINYQMYKKKSQKKKRTRSENLEDPQNK